MLAAKLLVGNSINRQSLSVLKKTTSCCRNVNISIKNYSTENEKKLSAMDELKANWDPVYRFPKIRTVSALNKLKNYQLAATVIGIPVTYAFFTEHLFTVGYLGATLVISLGLVSQLLKNSIGAVYIHKTDRNSVRIAYINFWGARKDSQFEIAEIVPFSDLPNSMTDKIYTKLKFHNGHEDLKLLSKEAEILDAENFNRIFGD